MQHRLQRKVFIVSKSNYLKNGKLCALCSAAARRSCFYLSTWWLKDFQLAFGRNRNCNKSLLSLKLSFLRKARLSLIHRHPLYTNSDIISFSFRNIAKYLHNRWGVRSAARRHKVCSHVGNIFHLTTVKRWWSILVFSDISRTGCTWAPWLWGRESKPPSQSR